MRRLFNQPGQFGNFIIGSLAARSDDDANLCLGKVVDQLLQHRQSWVGGVTYTEENLVIRIILAAKTGKVFVGIWIKSTHRL